MGMAVLQEADMVMAVVLVTTEETTVTMVAGTAAEIRTEWGAGSRPAHFRIIW